MLEIDAITAEYAIIAPNGDFVKDNRGETAVFWREEHATNEIKRIQADLVDMYGLELGSLPKYQLAYRETTISYWGTYEDDLATVTSIKEDK